MDKLDLHIHNHDGQLVEGEPRQCILQLEFLPGHGVTLHFHDGPCHPCPLGHCHDRCLTLIWNEQGQLILSLEGLPNPTQVSFEERANPHPVLDHMPEAMRAFVERRLGGPPLARVAEVAGDVDAKDVPFVSYPNPPHGGH